MICILFLLLRLPPLLPVLLVAVAPVDGDAPVLGRLLIFSKMKGALHDIRCPPSHRPANKNIFDAVRGALASASVYERTLSRSPADVASDIYIYIYIYI